MAILENRFAELKRVLPEFQELSATRIIYAAHLIADAFKRGNKLLICGNLNSREYQWGYKIKKWFIEKIHVLKKKLMFGRWARICHVELLPR